MIGIGIKKIKMYAMIYQSFEFKGYNKHLLFNIIQKNKKKINKQANVPEKKMEKNLPIIKMCVTLNYVQMNHEQLLYY